MEKFGGGYSSDVEIKNSNFEHRSDDKPLSLEKLQEIRSGNIESTKDKPLSISELNEIKSFDPDAKAEPSGTAETKQNEAGETAENKETEKDKYSGGSYGELKKEGHGDNSIPPQEVHHMPADSESPLERNDGPAIAMDKTDHRQTASCGNSLEAREYRAKQAELIKEGKFEEAMQMDIDDIHEKFGDKYDDAIAEMKEYAKEKEYI